MRYHFRLDNMKEDDIEEIRRKRLEEMKEDYKASLVSLVVILLPSNPLSHRSFVPRDMVNTRSCILKENSSK